MKDKEAVLLGVAGGLLIAGVASIGIDNLPRPQGAAVSKPLDGQEGEKQDCASLAQALGNYLLEGFKSSTGFDWMRAKGVKANEIRVLSTCSDSFQGTVVEEKGINVRRIPYNNDAWLIPGRALTWGEKITFPHIILVKEEEWGAVPVGDKDNPYFNFFIIKDKDGAEFVKVKNLPKPPEEPFPNNGNFDQDQGGFPYGRYPWAKRLESQPPNVGLVRAGGRVFGI